MSVAVPIAPRFFVFLAALAASLTLDLLFFFGARGSSASFTFFAFDRGAGGGHEPPRSASALVVRGRAASATVNAASSRAMARAMAPAATPRVSAALRVALLCAECHGKSCGDASQAGNPAALASLYYGSNHARITRLRPSCTARTRLQQLQGCMLVSYGR